MFALALLAVADDAPKSEPGLLCDIYDMQAAIEKFPVLPPDRKPTLAKVDAQIDFPSTGEKWPGTDLTEHFYIVWTGQLQVEVAGRYRLFLESDDGSRLLINSKETVSNPGLHGMTEVAAEVDLAAGRHEIRIEYFENEGDAGCKLSWLPPGGEKKIIPAAAFSHAVKPGQGK